MGSRRVHSKQTYGKHGAKAPTSKPKCSQKDGKGESQGVRTDTIPIWGNFRSALDTARHPGAAQKPPKTESKTHPRNDIKCRDVPTIPGSHNKFRIAWKFRSTDFSLKFRLVQLPRASLGKWGQSGENPARNTSNSAPVVEKSKSGMCFYPVGVRIIGVSALGPNSAILIFHTPGDHQNHHCFSP